VVGISGVDGGLRRSVGTPPAVPVSPPVCLRFRCKYCVIKEGNRAVSSYYRRSLLWNRGPL
jgi:hypothetical protein